MKTFEEFIEYAKDTVFINEAPMHLKGDAPFEDNVIKTRIGDVSETIIEKDYILEKDKFFKNFDLYMHKSKGYYCLGSWYIEEQSGKKRFGIINDLSFEFDKLRTKQKQLINEKFIKINTAHTTMSWRGNGISTSLYAYILSKGFSIISDSVQYDGAVKLWKGFTTVPNSVILIYDIVEDKIISKFTDKTPRNSVWSDDYSKSRIRLVFSSI